MSMLLQGRTYRGWERALPEKLFHRFLPTKLPRSLLSNASCLGRPLLELEALFVRTFLLYLHAKLSPSGYP